MAYCRSLGKWSSELARKIGHVYMRVATTIKHSEIAEFLFSTQISPPRQSIQPLARESTPEALMVRKRKLTLVYRIPNKPRDAPVPRTTPSSTLIEASLQVTQRPVEAQEQVSSTAPARLDGRPRREGKNNEYNRVMAIEKGRRRGGRRGGK